MEVVVGYEERNTWSGLIVSVIGLTAYVVVILQQAATRPITEVDWVAAMLWTVGGSIAALLAVNAVWSIVARRRDPDGGGPSDQRDRDISRMGDRVGQAFLVLGGLGAIVLCAIDAEPFWIANAVFAGFALSALIGGIAQVVAYRRGLA